MKPLNSSPPPAAASIRPFCASSPASSIISPSSAMISTFCRTISTTPVNSSQVPDKKELDLGKPLALAFTREFLPGDFDDVRQFFSRRGAYARFKGLLDQRDALAQWYAFEAKAEEQALREWCELNSIEVSDEERRSAD